MIVCGACTFLNSERVRVCDVCNSPLGKTTTTPTASRTTLPSSDEEDAEDERLQRFIGANIALFTDSSSDVSSSSTQCVCVFDRKTFRSTRMLGAHLYAAHRRELADLSADFHAAEDASADSLVTGGSASGAPQSSEPQTSALSDAEFALQLALAEYDDYHDNVARSSTKAEPKAERRVEQSAAQSQRSTRSAVAKPVRRSAPKDSLHFFSGGRSAAGRVKSRGAERAEAADDTDTTSRLGRLLEKTDKIVSTLRRSIQSIEPAEEQAEVRAPRLLVGSLRDYQLGGLQWLCGLHRAGVNGILADEMGLGKTVQVLSFLCLLAETFSVHEPHLVIVPLSVINSWRTDVHKFCPSVHLYVHHGERATRTASFDAWRRAYSRRGDGDGAVSIVLTTYEVVVADLALLAAFEKRVSPWGYMVVDEGHRLKNCESKLFVALQSLRPRRRLLLTGTPLQNNLGELWSLLHFLMPGIFNDFAQFSDWFNRPFETDDDDVAISRKKRRGKASKHAELLSEQEKGLIVDSLHRVLKPFLLRREKKDVTIEIPPRVERTLLCPWSALQRRVFADVLHAPVAPIDGLLSAEGEAVGNNVVMQLRKLSDHPFLILEDLRSIPDHLYYDQLVGSSGKLCMIDLLLPLLLADGHRLLIFCQFTAMLDILQGYLAGMGVACSRLDGSCSGRDREEALHAFEEEKRPVFLLSTRAGGVGLNLQGADTVLFVDQDWNPQMDNQAMARCHRIGQTRPVLVLRLAMEGLDADTPSVDQRILSVTSRKIVAEKEVLAARMFDMGTSTALCSEDGLLVSTDSLCRQHGNGASLLAMSRIVEACSRSSLPPSAPRPSAPSTALSLSAEQVAKFDDWFVSPDASVQPPMTADDARSSRGRRVKGVSMNEDEQWKQEMAKAELAYVAQSIASQAVTKRQREREPSAEVDVLEIEDTEVSERDDDAEEVCGVCGEGWIGDDDEDDVGGRSSSERKSVWGKSDEALSRLFVSPGDYASRERSCAPVDPSVANLLIICEACEGQFHMFCVGLESVPEGDWLCTDCS